MRIKRKFKGSKYKDNGGYLKSNSANNSTFKMIEGGDITMEGVDIPLIAVPLSEDAEVKGMKFMEPGKDYDFGDAAMTLEIPQYKKNGKASFINDRMKELQRNGLSRTEALKVATDMYNQKAYGGKVKGYGYGGKKQAGGRTPNNSSLLNEEELDLFVQDQDAMDLQNFAVGLPQGDRSFAQAQEIDFENALARERQIEEDSQPLEVELPEDPQEDFQFFNPYAGVDIPTTANLFGQSIGQKDTGMAIASGAKLGLGLARNFVSGLGRANANNFATDDLNRRRREALLDSDPVEFAQTGGLTSLDRDNIREELDIQFGDSYINEVFEKVQPIPKSKSKEPYKPNLGRFKGLDYFRPKRVQDNTIYLETGKRFPGNIDTMSQYVDQLRRENPGYKVDIKYNTRESFEEGGVAGEALLTGNYKTGSEVFPANVEVEVNEYMQTPEGELTKVLGRTHEKGGEKMMLPSGTRIISDHLKVKGNAKILRNEFDVKVKAGDTYAKAMDKFYAKSGLQDLIDEEQQVIEAIKKEKEAMAEGGETNTRNLNLDFLSGKINELNEAKQSLMEAAKIFFNKTYDLQEASKGTPKDERMQDGGEVFAGTTLGYVPEGQSQDGSTGLFGQVNPETFMRSVANNSSWFDFTGFDVRDPEDVTRYQKAVNQRIKELDLNILPLQVDGKWGEETNSVGMGKFEPEGPVLQSAGIQMPEVLINKLATGEALTEEEEEILEQVRQEESNSGVMLMPDQDLLPPTGLIPSVKTERRYGRLNAERLTPDVRLSELNREVDAAMSELDALPSGQREAAIVQLAANKQQAADKIIAETEAANNQISQQEDAFNIRQADREVDANAIDTLNFEQRSLGALANTEDDFRRYFNEGTRRNVENYKQIESLNLMNQLYENFDFTGSQVENTVDAGIGNDELMDMLRFQQAMAGSGDISVESKKGGKIKKDKPVSRLYRRRGSRVNRALNFRTPNDTKLS